jgi:DNA-binding response OmpR family regulator
LSEGNSVPDDFPSNSFADLTDAVRMQSPNVGLGARERLNVLWVDSDSAFVRALLHVLPSLAATWTIDVVDSPRAALSKFFAGKYNVVLTDLEFNGSVEPGLELVRGLRAGGSTVGLVVFSARDSEANREMALNSGADDFVKKGSHPDVFADLIKRANVAFSRRAGRAWSEGERTPTFRFGELQLDMVRQIVTGPGWSVELTGQQWRIFLQLALARGQQVSPQTLCHAAGIQDDPAHSNLRNHIRRLRKALGGEARRLIQSDRGRGYALRIRSR